MLKTKVDFTDPEMDYKLKCRQPLDADTPDYKFYMALALLTAQRSKDPRTQVGCCIYNPNGVVVVIFETQLTMKHPTALGYNGFPWGCDDGSLPWSRNAPSKLDTKHPYVCHAELNAVLNRCASDDLTGCSLAVTLYPCNQCTKVIVQSGIKRVVYLDRKPQDKAETLASQLMLKMAGIEVVPFDTIAQRPSPIVLNIAPNLDKESSDQYPPSC